MLEQVLDDDLEIRVDGLSGSSRPEDALIPFPSATDAETITSTTTSTAAPPPALIGAGSGGVGEGDSGQILSTNTSSSTTNSLEDDLYG